MKRTCVLSLLAAALVAWPRGYAAEGDRPADAQPAPAAKDGRAADRPAWGGRGGGGGGGFGGGGFQGFGGGGGMPGIVDMASRMLGLDIQDPKAGPKLDALPLGADKRFVFNVPVGGVDNPGSTTNGWKMEAIFKMTDEQTKSAEALRAEYAVEEKKLEQEIQDQFKTQADKLKQLRLKYEQRANDILTADDKQRKEKLDALARETNAKNMDIIKELLALYDVNDWQQRMALSGAIRDRVGKNDQEAESKLVELVPPESRDKIEAVVKQQTQAREMMARWGQGMGQGMGRGMRGQQDQTPAKPPRPPEADKKQDF